MGCCTGRPIDEFQDLRSPEQKAVMAILGPIIQAQMKAGATPYPGMINAPWDRALIASMNTMMGLGGHGGYVPPPIPLYPIGMSGGLGGGGGYYDPGMNHHGGQAPNIPGYQVPSEDWWKYDPYNPSITPPWHEKGGRKK